MTATTTLVSGTVLYLSDGMNLSTNLVINSGAYVVFVGNADNVTLTGDLTNNGVLGSIAYTGTFTVTGTISGCGQYLGSTSTLRPASCDSTSGTTINNVVDYVTCSTALTVKLYDSPYFFSSSLEKDITEEVFNNTGRLELCIGDHHRLRLRLRNTKYEFYDTTSDYYMFRGRRIEFGFNGQTYKFMIEKPPTKVSEDTIEVHCVYHSMDMEGHITQIRCQPDMDGNTYLEDVLYRALYDTGLHNFFKIKLQDGNYYDLETSVENKISIFSDNEMVFWGQSVKEVLDDLCSRTGCIWYMTDDTTSDRHSVINIIDATTDYDTPSSNIIYVSGYHNVSDISFVEDKTTVTNYIYIEGLGVELSDEVSIDEYGQRNPMKIAPGENLNTSQLLEYANSYLSVAKDPETEVTIELPRFLDVTDMDQMVKVINENGTYDTASGFDRKYRLRSITFDLSGEKTTMTAGTLGRSYRLERLEDLLKGDNGTMDENEARELVKGDDILLQIYTDDTLRGSDVVTASTGGLYSTRIGIDTVFNTTYNPTARFYMDDDGIRNGN